MGAGPELGAISGGLLVGIVAPGVLKLALGVVLIGSASRVLRATRQPEPETLPTLA